LLLACCFCSTSYGQKITELSRLIREGKEDEALARIKDMDQTNNVVLINLTGEALLRKGRYDQAREKFEQAEYMGSQEDPLDKSLMGEIYSNMGLLQMTTGNNALSLQYHFKALEIRDALEDPLALGASLNNIGLVYSKGDPEIALNYYKKALKAYQKAGNLASDKIATALINIGVVYSNLDFYEEAMENLEKALEMRTDKSGSESPQVAFVHASIGRVYTKMKEPESALQEFEIALAIYRKNYGNRHPEIASTYNLMGNTLHAEGKFIEALYRFQQALQANLREYDNSDIYSNPSANNYFDADVLLESLYQKALTFEDLHTSYSLKIKDLDMAYQTLSICDQLIDDIRQFRTSEADKVAFGEKATKVYESAIRVSLEMAGVKWKDSSFKQRAFYYADKSKSAVLLEAIADTKAKSYAGIPDELLEQEKLMKAEIAYYEQKLASKIFPEEEKEYREQLFDWTKNYNDLISSLEIQYPTYYNLKHNKTVPNISDIQEKLASNQALLSYFVASEDKRLYAFLITKKKFTVADVSLSKNYQRNISGYRNAMYYDAPQTYLATARELNDQLFPFHIPGNVNSLVIVPSGRMATIPFEALIADKGRESRDDFSRLPYLVNRYDISYEYAASLFVSPVTKSPGREAISLFAPVKFNSRQLSDLPGTEKEVEDIGDLFAGGTSKVGLYLGDEANRDQVRSDAVTSSRYLHFATHGIIDEDRPERSQICLAADSTSSGSLYSGDIYALRLDADLAVLSACETGLGKLSQGEGIIGLTRALIYAGCNNLVVSLWRVNDTSTSAMMTDFYRAMIQGDTYAQSLKLAKERMIKSKKYSSPYYWAPFVLVGH